MLRRIFLKQISAFDVIGPIMVGPSSSHTAGALKISRICNLIANSKIISVDFTLYGSFSKTYKGHGTDRALLGGILGYNTDDLRIANSIETATKSDLIFSFIPDFETKQDHPNTILIEATTEKNQKISVLGVSTGGGAIKIININGIDVNFKGEYHTILIEQIDTKGVISSITSSLSDVNIAFMRVFRHKKGGTAFTIIETDENIPSEISAKIKKLDNIVDISIIKI